ncbi:hypothetical protein Tco_0488389 [Tanacetum coccineum]
MKAVKEKEQLQKIVDSWKDSSKNLWKLVNSGMSSNSKVGLGYGIKSNNEVLSYEEEMNRTVFNCTEEDFVEKPLYNRFSKTDNLKGDPTILAGSFGNPSEHSVEFESEIISVPKEVSESKSVTTNEKVMSEPKPKEVAPSCVTHVKTPRKPMKNQETPKVNRKNLNEMMERELGKKMAREAELKKQRVFNTGNGGSKTVWNNANRVNHANHFVPRPVQLNVVRPNNISVRPNVNTVRQNVNSVRSNVNTIRPKQPVPTSNSNSFSPVRPQVHKADQNPEKALGPKETILFSCAGDHPLKNIEDIGIFDSGCSGHMTGNKDHLDDFEECKGGSVTFGGSKGYITGTSRIYNFSKLIFDGMVLLLVESRVQDNISSSYSTRHLLNHFPSSSPPPVISATTESEPTPVAESITHPNSLSPEPDNEPIEHTFEQPSSEHQPLLPRQEIEIPNLRIVDSLEKELKQTKLTMGKAISTRILKILTKQCEELSRGKGSMILGPEGLKQLKPLAKESYSKNKTYTKENVNTAFEEIKSGDDEVNSGDESIIPSPKKEIVRLQAQEEAENARKAELQRQDALIAKRVQDELELSETQKNRMAQVQEAAKYYTEED